MGKNDRFYLSHTLQYSLKLALLAYVLHGVRVATGREWRGYKKNIGTLFGVPSCLVNNSRLLFALASEEY